MVTARTRSCPAENGWTGHQTPIVRTKVSNVCVALLRTRTDWRIGGRASAVTAARSSGSGVAVMHASWLRTRVADHVHGPVQVVAESAKRQCPQADQPCVPRLHQLAASLLAAGPAGRLSRHWLPDHGR